MNALKTGLLSFFHWMARRFVAAETWLLLLGIAGVFLLICGTFLLAGAAWALIAAGAIFVALAALILVGVARG